jgi:hypothetical protein
MRHPAAQAPLGKDGEHTARKFALARGRATGSGGAPDRDQRGRGQAVATSRLKALAFGQKAS